MFPATNEPKDHFAKARAHDYFDQLLTANPAKLFGKYAVHPPDNAKYTVPSAEPREFGRFAGSVQAGIVNVGAVPADHLIAWAHLTKKARTASLTEGAEGADCIFMEASHTRNDAHVPIYFLPWADMQILHMTIPPKNPNANALDPDIFFTSAINGCSVFIQGTPQSPTIFHCGGSPTAQETGRNSATVWRQLTNFYTGKQSVAEVNKTHYVREFGNDEVATQRSIDYVNTLSQIRPNIQVTSVQPWGCVFGFRNAQGNWQFYLQENATLHIYAITGQKVDIVKRTFKPDKLKITDIATEKTYARPMVVRQVWPGHGGAVTLTPHLPIVTRL